jgi:hypothetical protein
MVNNIILTAGIQAPGLLEKIGGLRGLIGCGKGHHYPNGLAEIVSASNEFSDQETLKS